MEGQIAALLAELDQPDIHPLDGLLDAVRRTASMTAVLGGLVGELHPTYEHEAVRHGSASLYGPDHKGDARPHVLMSLYGQWCDRYARACKLALDAGIDERRLRMAEADVERLFTCIGAAITSAGLSPEQKEVFESVLAAQLRATEPALPAG